MGEWGKMVRKKGPARIPQTGYAGYGEDIGEDGNGWSSIEV